MFLSDVLKFNPDALAFFTGTLVFLSDANETILQDPQALDDLLSALVHGKHKLILQ